MLALAQVDVEIAEREIGRDQAQVRVRRRRNQFEQLTFATDQLLRGSPVVRLALQRVGRRSLGIEIPQHRRPSRLRCEISEVNGGRGLSHSALDVAYGDDLHGATMIDG